MKNRTVGLILLGMFIVLFLAMHVVAFRTFGGVFNNIKHLFDASPALTLVTGCFLGAGIYYLTQRDR